MEWGGEGVSELLACLVGWLAGWLVCWFLLGIVAFIDFSYCFYPSVIYN